MVDSKRIRLADLLKLSARGFSIIEVLIAISIMSIVALGTATMMQEQSNNIRSLEEKMNLLNLQTQLSNVLLSPKYCSCMIGANTFNYQARKWNALPTTISSSYNGVTCAPVGEPTVAVGRPIGGSNLKPVNISFANVVETVSGTGNFTADLRVDFDQTTLARPRKPVLIPIYFSVQMTAPSYARPLNACGPGAQAVAVSGNTCSWIGINSSSFPQHGSLICPRDGILKGIESYWCDPDRGPNDYCFRVYCCS